MKRNLFFALFIFAASTLVAQNRPYKGDITVKPLVLEQRGDSLYVNLDFIFKNIDVKSRNNLNFTPVLATDTHSEKLSAVEIKGCNNYKSYVRAQALMSRREREGLADTYKVCKARKVSNATLHYAQALPFEEWMRYAHLDIRQTISGCGKSSLLAVEQLINAVSMEPVIEPYRVQPQVAYVQPKAEAIKHRELVSEAFLDFVVAKTDIRPEFGNNPRELAKLRAMIEDVRDDKDVSIRHIAIAGYASPEGRLDMNKRFAEGRATVLLEYFRSRYNDIPARLYGVEFGGEDWAGLVRAVEASGADYSEEVLAIIRDTDDPVQRKQLLRALRNGAPYAEMLRDIYPSLRRVTCKVDYDVKSFNVEEAKEVISRRPQNLSLNEMFHVANTYQSGSPEFVEVFETAVRMFPEDQTANLNAASAALARHDATAAAKYLAKVDASNKLPEYRNALGLLALLREDYEGARTHFEAAFTAGLEQAKLNLEELDRKLENVARIEAQKK